MVDITKHWSTIFIGVKLFFTRFLVSCVLNKLTPRHNGRHFADFSDCTKHKFR